MSEFILIQQMQQSSCCPTAESVAKHQSTHILLCISYHFMIKHDLTLLTLSFRSRAPVPTVKGTEDAIAASTIGLLHNNIFFSMHIPLLQEVNCLPWGWATGQHPPLSPFTHTHSVKRIRHACQTLLLWLGWADRCPLQCGQNLLQSLTGTGWINCAKLLDCWTWKKWFCFCKGSFGFFYDLIS